MLLRPIDLPPSEVIQHRQDISLNRNPCFVVHPETSVLAEQLLVDASALSEENYSGVFDETGDYIPQYCDNPDDVPRGMDISANQQEPKPGGATGPSNTSGEQKPFLSDPEPGSSSSQ